MTEFKQCKKIIKTELIQSQKNITPSRASSFSSWNKFRIRSGRK